MPTHINRPTDSLIDRILADYERTGHLPGFSGGDHEEPPAPPPDPPKPPADPDEPLGENGKKALEAEREARRTAEKAAKDANDRAAALEAEAKKRADKEAEEAGRWQELAEKREADLTEATAKADTLQAQLDEALQALRDDVTAAWKDTPDEVKDLYEGDDDDVLAKRKHLTRSAKLIARLTTEKQSPRGNGEDPPPRGKTDIDMNKETQRTVRTVRF